jgi:hypothetical protein
MRDPGSIPKGVLMRNRDSPVDVVLLKYKLDFGEIFEGIGHSANIDPADEE